VDWVPRGWGNSSDFKERLVTDRGFEEKNLVGKGGETEQVKQRPRDWGESGAHWNGHGEKVAPGEAFTRGPERPTTRTNQSRFCTIDTKSGGPGEKKHRAIRNLPTSEGIPVKAGKHAGGAA